MSASVISMLSFNLNTFSQCFVNCDVTKLTYKRLINLISFLNFFHQKLARRVYKLNINLQILKKFRFLIARINVNVMEITRYGTLSDI